MAVVGGTASVLGGGKFASGAMAGAFMQMFNAEVTKVILDARSREAMERIRKILKNGKTLQKALLVGTVFNQFLGSKSWEAGLTASVEDWNSLAQAMMGAEDMTRGRAYDLAYRMQFTYSQENNYELSEYWRNMSDALSK